MKVILGNAHVGSLTEAQFTPKTRPCEVDAAFKNVQQTAGADQQGCLTT